MNHLLSCEDFKSPKEIEEFFVHAKLMRSPYKNIDPYYLLRGKTVGLLFFEKSTRTRVSFEIAAKKLGAETFFIDDTNAKTERIEDSLKVLSTYADLLVVRHPEDITKAIVDNCDVPVISAGMSDLEHPTQALIDLYTIKLELNKIHGLKILFIGDMKHGRTVHSLLKLISAYQCITVYMLPADQSVAMSDEEMKQYKNIHFKHVNFADINDVLPNVDVVYLNRIQTERMESSAPPAKFAFGKNELDLMKKKSIILHPLPRMNELDPAVDSDSRAAYFKQVENGKYLRMGMLYSILRTS